MAQMSERSKPQFYNLVNGLGEIVVLHVAYSRVVQVMIQYEKDHGEKLKAELVK